MKILTTNKGIYKGKKDQAWTESLTNSFILKENSLFVHKSYEKINAFEIGVETCVYNEMYSQEILNSFSYNDIRKENIIKDLTHKVRPDNPEEYVYIMYVPKGIQISEYGNEYRFIMNDSVKIELIGTMGTVRVRDDSYETKVYGGHTINVFTEKYK